MLLEVCISSPPDILWLCPPISCQKSKGIQRIKNVGDPCGIGWILLFHHCMWRSVNLSQLYLVNWFYTINCLLHFGKKNNIKITLWNLQWNSWGKIFYIYCNFGIILKENEGHIWMKCSLHTLTSDFKFGFSSVNSLFSLANYLCWKTDTWVFSINYLESLHYFSTMRFGNVMDHIAQLELRNTML